MPKRSTVASQSALSLIADVGASEHGDLARVRQRRPGREVDEHFGGRLIEPEDRDVLARRRSAGAAIRSGRSPR